MDPLTYPIRINKFLAARKLSTRRGADDLIRKGHVLINDRKAHLGDTVTLHDIVRVTSLQKKFHYLAFNKPRNVVTHSPQGTEKGISDLIDAKKVAPIGRLDKDSEGLIILSDDGRITDALLNPKFFHEKEYHVSCSAKLPSGFKRQMERGVNIGGYVTRPCSVRLFGDRSFSIIITEGKNRQIRKMCGALGQSVTDLRRVRIMNVHLGTIPSGSYRFIVGEELTTFLGNLGL